MNEEYDRREYNCARRKNDRYRVYVCWRLNGKRELFISHPAYIGRIQLEDLVLRQKPQVWKAPKKNGPDSFF